MWIPFIGSESVSFSVTSLFVAAAVWLVVDWKAYKVLLLLAAAFLMAFSRDTLAYLLLFLAAIVLTLLWFPAHRRHLLVILAGFLAIFGASMYAAQAARRFEVVFPIITGLRIFPNPQYVAYFREHGMPVDEKSRAAQRPQFAQLRQVGRSAGAVVGSRTEAVSHMDEGARRQELR